MSEDPQRPEEHPGGLYGDDPSPEEVFSGAKVNVFLTDANDDPTVRFRVLLGLRTALSGLLGTRAHVKAAQVLWNAWEKGQRPLLLGFADGAEAAQAIAEEAVEASKDSQNPEGNLVIGYGLDAADIRNAARERPEDPAEPEAPVVDVPEEPVIEDVAAKVALVLMAMNDGSPTRSYTFARILRKDTGDSLWADAASLIDRSFPNVMNEDVSG